MAVDLVVNGEVLRDVRLVVFDKDGTLMDVHAYWANMVRMRAETVCRRLNLDRSTMHGIMDSMGVDVQRTCVKPNGPVGLRKREVVLQAGVDCLIASGLGDQTDLFVDVFREVDACSLSRFSEIVRPIEGLYPLVEALRTSGCKMGVATSDRTDRARLALEHLGILDDLDRVVGADMITRPKPAPEVIHTICERLDIPEQRTVMVGDSASDVETGLSAGCLASIGVASGLTPREQLTALTPHVVSDISAIGVRATVRSGHE
jgi:HAD superfamily hydrolase (TIGR01509 family)